MAKEMWRAEIEDLLQRLQDSRPLRDVAARLRNIFRGSAYDEVEQQALELEEDQFFVLKGNGSIFPDDKVTAKMTTLITNSRQSEDNQRQAIASLKRQIARLYGALEGRRGYVTQHHREVQTFYDELPPEQKRFWSAPEYDREEPDWMVKYPQPVDKWYAVRPDVLSPRHAAFARALKRKLEGK